MIVEVPYNKEPLLLNLPDGAEIIYPNRVARRDEDEVIAFALASPVNFPPLADFLTGPGKTLVIVNDSSRTTPTARILRRIGPELAAADCRYIVATGSHRAPTAAELKGIFGAALPEIRSRLSVHNCDNAADMYYTGTTPRGTEVYLNRAVADADRCVVIGSVEPHYFAGYTGGRKAFLPGLAARGTITANHKLALSPEARILTLAGNPVNDDMADALHLLDGKGVFSIMTALDGEHRVYAASAGEVRATLEECAAAADEVFRVPLARKADVVITVALPPLDMDLYQAHKAIENARPALAPGGLMILVAACPGGVGYGEFLELLRGGDYASIMARLEREYKLGWHKAAKLAELAGRGPVFVVSDLPAEVLADTPLKPYRDLSRAVGVALALKGAGANIAVIMDGAMCVPVVG